MDNISSGENATQQLNFRLEKSPAVSENINLPMYSRVRVQNDEQSHGRPEAKEHLEMDFRKHVSSHPGSTYATHQIHKHPAVFIPHIPRHIIETYTTKENVSGDRPLIYDPFSGSGTTGLEAKLLGRDYLGVELNPFSKLVSDVKTTPIPPSLARQAKQDLENILDNLDKEYFDSYDPDFLDTTNKETWFEKSAICGLTQIRRALDKLDVYNYEILPLDQKKENLAAKDLDIGESELQERLYRWLVLMIANTVFEVSNADPGVSKAYKSPKMKDLIEDGDHPPDPVQTFKSELDASLERLEEFWKMIYYDSTIESVDSCSIDLDSNHAHKATTDVHVGDARKFSDEDYHESVDLAITSPPYINAMNYYRGTKLRLFWIHDLIEEFVDSNELRKSIVGTNSVSIRGIEKLPKTTLGQWDGTIEEYKQTSLLELDRIIIDIHSGELSEAKRRAYTTWKFFNVDMIQSLTRTYELLKPGAHFFLIIGENTIGGNQIQSHKHIADIAQNLGKFSNHGGDIGHEDGYRFVGFAWDKISNRELFQSRNHSNGVIEGEWIVILQKPS